MRKLEFVGTVKSVSATSVSLTLNTVVLDLVRNGDTWTGKRSIGVDQSVAVHFTARGFDGTKWSLEIDTTCPDGPAKIFSKDGTIGGSGRSTIDTSVPIRSLDADWVLEGERSSRQGARPAVRIHHATGAR